MNHRFKDDELYWHDGSIISNDGKEYKDLKIKYNTIDNSINVKLDDRYFRIHSHRIIGFDLKAKGRVHIFRRGFNENRKHELTAFYTIGATETLQYLTEYENISNFKILRLETNKKKKSDGDLNIQFYSPSNNASYAFQSYLKKNHGIMDVSVNTNGTGIDESRFFEVLAEGKQGKLLKLHSKRSGQSESVSLAKVPDPTVVTFDKHSYFLSNDENDIQPIFLNKKSVKKALDFTEIEFGKRISSIRSEKKITAFFNKIL